MNKPEWDGAPKWAEWLAMDADGDWWWYQNEPTRMQDCWGLGKKACYAHTTDGQPDWTATLESRP